MKNHGKNYHGKNYGYHGIYHTTIPWYTMGNIMIPYHDMVKRYHGTMVE
jgi:hypothetical protein